jgi:hypothetical protein
MPAPQTWNLDSIVEQRDLVIIVVVFAMFAGTIAFSLTRTASKIDFAFEDWLHARIGDRGIKAFAKFMMVVCFGLGTYWFATDLFTGLKALWLQYR